MFLATELLSCHFCHFTADLLSLLLGQPIMLLLIWPLTFHPRLLGQRRLPSPPPCENPRVLHTGHRCVCIGRRWISGVCSQQWGRTGSPPHWVPCYGSTPRKFLFLIQREYPRGLLLLLFWYQCYVPARKTGICFYFSIFIWTFYSVWTSSLTHPHFKQT